MCNIKKFMTVKCTVHWAQVKSFDKILLSTKLKKKVLFETQLLKEKLKCKTNPQPCFLEKK